MLKGGNSNVLFALCYLLAMVQVIVVAITQSFGNLDHLHEAKNLGQRALVYLSIYKQFFV